MERSYFLCRGELNSAAWLGGMRFVRKVLVGLRPSAVFTQYDQGWIEWPYKQR